MNKFLFKSNDSDLQKLYINKFDLINKNILYITHRVDLIVKLLEATKTDSDLQQQVDQYFEDTPQEDTKRDLD